MSSVCLQMVKNRPRTLPQEGGKIDDGILHNDTDRDGDCSDDSTENPNAIVNNNRVEASSLFQKNPRQLEHEVCIQLALAAKQRHEESTNQKKNTCSASDADMLCHYGDLLEQLLADPDTMEAYFRLTSTNEDGSRTGSSSKEINHSAEELVSKVRQTARERGFTLDARISDTMLFNSIRRFYNTQLRYAEDRLTSVAKNNANDDEIISILCRLQKQNFSDHHDNDTEHESSDDENNITPRANNKSAYGTFGETNPNTTITSATTVAIAEPKSPQMEVERSPSRKRCVVDMKACQLPVSLPRKEKDTTGSPEDARHIKRSKTSHNQSSNSSSSSVNNINNDDNTTTQSSSSASGSAPSPHSQTKHQRNEASSPTSSCNSDGAGSDNDTSRNKTRPILSREGSYEFHVSERLREISLTESIMEVDARDEDIAELLAFVRLRRAEGLYRSAIKFCHDTLQRLYQDACSVASQPSARNYMLLKSYRETVAGVWCMYATFLHEIGDCNKTEELATVAASAEPMGTEKQRSTSSHSVSATDDWRDYALATLASVTRCPLVGNHQAISLATARILAPVSDGQDSCCPRKADSVSDALAACQDGIRRCECHCVREPQNYCPILLNEMDFHRMARYHGDVSAAKQDRVSVSELQASFEAVMKLPLLLEPTSSQYYLRDGRAGIPLILAEMTRLDKLVSKNHPHPADDGDRKPPARPATSTSSISLEDAMDTESAVSSSSTFSSTRQQLFAKVCMSCSRRLSVMELEVRSNMCFECQNQCSTVGNLA